MALFNQSPLTFSSLGFKNTNDLLAGIGGNYGYKGVVDRNNPIGSQGDYIIDNHVFRSQDDFKNLQGYLGSRASFLDEQSRTNPEAYKEYATNPYAFQGNTAFQTAAQKAASQEAARQAALLSSQGGTSLSGGNTSTISGKTSTGTPIANLAPLPIPTTQQLPEYIPPNNNALLKELENLLGNIPKLFSTKGIADSFKNRISLDESFGGQTASNAAAEFANRTRSEGGDASLAGLVRAQALLPVLQHSGELQSDLASKKLQSRQAKGTLTGNVAEALANLRTNYLQGLIDYTGKIQDIQSTNQISTQRLNEQQREFDLGNQLDLSRLKLQERQQTDSENQNKLQSILALANLQGRKVDPRNRDFTPSYAGSQATNDPYKLGYNSNIEDLIARIQGLT